MINHIKPNSDFIVSFPPLGRSPGQTLGLDSSLVLGSISSFCVHVSSLWTHSMECLAPSNVCEVTLYGGLLKHHPPCCGKISYSNGFDGTTCHSGLVKMAVASNLTWYLNFFEGSISVPLESKATKSKPDALECAGGEQQKNERKGDSQHPWGPGCIPFLFLFVCPRQRLALYSWRAAHLCLPNWLKMCTTMPRSHCILKPEFCKNMLMVRNKVFVFMCVAEVCVCHMVKKAA